MAQLQGAHRLRSGRQSKPGKLGDWLLPRRYGTHVSSRTCCGRQALRNQPQLRPGLLSGRAFLPRQCRYHHAVHRRAGLPQKGKEGELGQWAAWKWF